MVLMAAHHERKEEGFRRRSSSRWRSWVVRRSGWVSGVGIGEVKGNIEDILDGMAI